MRLQPFKSPFLVSTSVLILPHIHDRMGQPSASTTEDKVAEKEVSAATGTEARGAPRSSSCRPAASSPSLPPRKTYAAKNLTQALVSRIKGAAGSKPQHSSSLSHAASASSTGGGTASSFAAALATPLTTSNTGNSAVPATGSHRLTLLKTGSGIGVDMSGKRMVAPTAAEVAGHAGRGGSSGSGSMMATVLSAAPCNPVGGWGNKLVPPSPAAPPVPSPISSGKSESPTSGREGALTAGEGTPIRKRAGLADESMEEDDAFRPSARFSYQVEKEEAKDRRRVSLQSEALPSPSTGPTQGEGGDWRDRRRSPHATSPPFPPSAGPL